MTQATAGPAAGSAGGWASVLAGTATRWRAAAQRLDAVWNALPRRQQLMVLAAIVVLGIGITDLAVLSPTDRQQSDLRQQLAGLQQQAARLQAAAAKVDQEQRALRDEEAELRGRLERADQAIAGAAAAIADPAAMRQRIRDLSQDASVRLLSLATLPAEPVQPGVAGGSADAARVPPAGASELPVLYRIPIQVTVEGPYAALREYLQRLETSEAGLRWQSVSLDNRDWPAVRLEIRLFVLGDRPVWKGP